MALTQVQGGMILASGQSIPKAALPTGSVLQVVNTTSTIGSQVSTTSTSYTATGYSLSITPTASSSKILVVHSAIIGNNTAGKGCYLALYRNGSQLAPYAGFNSGMICSLTNAGTLFTSGSFTYLDSPATTSSTTYAIYYCTDSGGTAYYSPSPGFFNAGTMSIILMEIAA